MADRPSRVFSVRVPDEIATAFDERLELLGTNRQAVLAEAARQFAAPVLNTSASVSQSNTPARPDRVDAIDLEGRPGTFSPAAAALLNDPAYRRRELAYRARHRAGAHAPAPVNVSYLSPEERAQYQAALAGRVGAPAVAATPTRKAPPTTSAPAPAKPRPAQPAATRESLCQHLGLSARAHGGEIRRVAKNVASGLRGMGSSPERATALRAHFGLALTASTDEVMSAVWDLTTPAGSKITNPFAARLASAKGAKR